MGTWKLNEAKSKFSPGAAKNTTVVYEAAGDSVKVTVDGVGADGKPSHNEWTGKFDGKDYPLTGDPTADSRSYKKIDARTMELTNKKGGKACRHRKDHCFGRRQVPHRHYQRHRRQRQKSQRTAVYDKQ